MSAGKRDYGGETGEERAARRREALVAAAFEVLAADGRGALRIEPLCRAAGLNKRYFYESFADLDALVAAVLAQLGSEAVAATLAALDDREGEAGARAAVVGLLEHLVEDGRRARVLFGAVALGDAAAQPRADALREIARLAADRGSGLYAMPVDARVDLLAAMLVGGTGQALLDWLDGRIDLSREAMIEELAVTWLGVAEAALRRFRAGA